MMNRNLQFISQEQALRIMDLTKSLAKDYLKLAYAEEATAITSFGVFLDGDMSTFLLGYNTAEREETDDDEADYQTWWIPDWMNGVDEETFNGDAREIELFRIFESLHDAMEEEEEDCDDDDDYVRYKNDLLYLLCKSLLELKADQVFTKVSEDFFLLVQVQDEGVDEYKQKLLSTMMTPAQLSAYLQFDKEW